MTAIQTLAVIGAGDMGHGITEVALIAVTFTLAGWAFGWVGVTSAFVAFLVGRAGANAFLVPPVRMVLARSRALRAADEAEDAPHAPA